MANENFTTAEKRSLQQFINRKFAQMDQYKVGLTYLIKHNIMMREDVIPWHQESYETNFRIREMLYDEIDYLINIGYIRKCNSDNEWLSQARMVKDKHDNWVFYIDYGKVNSYLDKWNYPVHSHWKTLRKLEKPRMISTIRIKDAFHHIKLERESRQYTAFHIPGRGVFEWVRMPYGLKGGPATYCYVADETRKLALHRIQSWFPTIKNISDKLFVCYETWIVISKTLNEHMIILNCLFDVLYEVGFEVDGTRSQFAKESINYFGFTIDYNGLHVNQKVIKPIINYPRPTSVAEVRQFNGMVNHYCNHIKNISMIQGPLNKFFAKTAIWKWTEQEEDAFNDTKSALLNAPSLSVPNPELSYRLYTYVTCSGLGAKLVQYDDWDDSEYLITYFSSIFKDAERSYPAIDKKILSIVRALSNIRHLVEGNECEVSIDHSVLCWYKNEEDISSRLSQWRNFLINFDVKLTLTYEPNQLFGSCDTCASSD